LTDISKTLSLLVVERRLSVLVAQRVLGWLSDALAEFRIELRAFGVSSWKEKQQLLVVISALVGGVLFRLQYLGRDFRFDEAYTFVDFASKPFLFAISSYTEPNNHILHTVGVWITTRLWGIDPEVIRIPALLAGILLIPACGLAAAAFYGKRAFAPAAVVMAFLPCWVAYSVNARGYTMQGLFFALALACAGALLRRPELKWPWVGLVGCASLAIYTVPTSILIFFTLGVWMHLQNQTQWRKWLVTGAATGIFVMGLYLPVFLTSGWSSVFGNKYVVPLSWAQYWLEAPELVRSLVKLVLLGLPKQLIVLVPLLLAASFFLPVADGKGRARLPLAFFFLVSAVGFSIGRQVLSGNRVWLYLTIPMIVLMAKVFVEIEFQLPKYGTRLATVFFVLYPLGAIAGSHIRKSLVGDESGFRIPEAAEVVELLQGLAKPGEARISGSKMARTVLEYHILLRRPELEICVRDEKTGTPIYIFIEIPEQAAEEAIAAKLEDMKRRVRLKVILEVVDRPTRDFRLIRRWSNSALFRVDPLP
jgi:hypothetical protein